MKNENNFIFLLEKLLISEHEYTKAKAKSIIRNYPDIIICGLMKGSFALNATAMALIGKDKKEVSNVKHKKTNK